MRPRPGNPLEEMTWEQRFMFAFHALIVLEGKYEDAVEELRQTRADHYERERARHAVERAERNAASLPVIRGLRAEGLSYRDISKRLLRTSGQQLESVVA